MKELKAKIGPKNFIPSTLDEKTKSKNEMIYP
jgi:hypothetical protein